jgi:cytochrome P450
LLRRGGAVDNLNASLSALFELTATNAGRIDSMAPGSPSLAPGLFGPEMLADPYPAYHRLRAVAPVVWAEAFQGWILTRYEDVAAVLRDARFSAKRYGNLAEQADARGQTDVAEMYRMRAGAMLGCDGPRHTRLRSLVSKAFTPRAVAAMRPRIAELVKQMLDEAQARGPIDLMRDLAAPLPVAVIAAMLGIPPEDRARFKQWSNDIAATANLPESLSEPVLRRAATAYHELAGYLRGLIGRMRSGQAAGLLAAMAAAEEQGDQLTEPELYANASLLLNAGHETTTNLIGNGTLALLRQPAEWQRLVADPAQVEAAIEELLRYDSPVQFSSRTPLEDVVLGEHTIAAGQKVLVVLGAANRDPAMFPDPDRLDVSRAEAVHHVAFGMGPHYCLGAPLARLEGQVVLETLVRRYPALHLEGEPPVYRENFNLRGLVRLPVGF